MSISKSLFSLVKNNNGFFKSDKQAAFLLSQCQEEYSYVGGNGSIYGNSFFFEFYMDQNGITSVVKHTNNDSKTQWMRMDDDEFASIMNLKKELRTIATWVNKAGNIVNNFETHSIQKLLKMIPVGKPEQDCLVCVELHKKWEAKIKDLKQQIQTKTDYYDANITKTLIRKS